MVYNTAGSDIEEANFIIEMPAANSGASAYSLQIAAMGNEGDELVEVSQQTIQVVPGSSKQSFFIAYDCKGLLAKGGNYYDSILVGYTDGQDSSAFEYVIVCDPNQMKGFDLNFIVLFVAAVICQIIAIKTPDFALLDEMTAEEQESTDMKISSAIWFFVVATAMLVLLYLFIDYLRGIFTLLVLLSCIGCFSILVEELLIGYSKHYNSDSL